MLWTAPALRHQSAKGGCAEANHIEGAVHSIKLANAHSEQMISFPPDKRHHTLRFCQSRLRDPALKHHQQTAAFVSVLAIKVIHGSTTAITDCSPGDGVLVEDQSTIK